MSRSELKGIWEMGWEELAYATLLIDYMYEDWMVHGLIAKSERLL